MEPSEETSKCPEGADLGPLPIAVMPEEIENEKSHGSSEEGRGSGGRTASDQAPGDAPAMDKAEQSMMFTVEESPLQERVKKVEGRTETNKRRSMKVLHSDDSPPSIDKRPPDDDETSSLASTDNHYQQQHHQQEDVEDDLEEQTVFKGLTYLGSSTVDAPMSPSEANNKMITFKEQHAQAIPVNLSIPQTNGGKMVMLDPLSNTPLAVFYIKTVLLCVRGQDLEVSDCMCINVRHRKSQTFHCHVFLVHSEETCEKLFRSIGSAFRTKPSDLEILRDGFQLQYEIEVTIDIQEDHDGRSNYHGVAMDKECFKLRQGAPKMITMSIAQPSSSRPLVVDKCFGTLIAPGRMVPPTDMILLDMVSMGYSSERVYTIVAAFDPADLPAKELNEETPKGSKAYLTVAADLVLRGIAEPVRFLREVEIRIYKGDSFDLFGSLRKRRQSVETFILQVAKSPNSVLKSPQYCISVMQSSEGKQQLQPYAAIPSTVESKSPLPPTQGEGEGGEADSDQEFLEDDEILMSGWGDMNKEFSDDLVGEWGVMLEKWDGQDKSRPKSLRKLCRKGIPGPLRCQVWQLLTTASFDPQLVDAYRLLITMESPTKDVIVWDIKRTYVAHEFFREPSGREALEKISKAYSVYDEEVGYCQGLSFIVAVLLLQKLPEEMAFAVLVKIMFDNRHRDLFKGSFEVLHLCLYQLSRLVEEYMPDLNDHFTKHRVEVHMFATQWFFTLFTAKFPLPLVFQFMDIYLCDRMPAMFQAALALLKTAKKELLLLDFEGMLKYFRVSLPRKFLTLEECNHFFRRMAAFKVDERRLKKFEKEYQSLLEAKALAENPQERLKEENSRLQEAVGRLEHENECLAQELVASKINLREEMDKLEEKVDSLSKEVRKYQRDAETARATIAELSLELQQVQSKEMCNEMTAKLAEERQHHQVAISEYRTAFRQLDEGNMKEQEDLKQQLAVLKVSKGVSDEDENKVAKGNHESCTKLEKQVRELELELAQTKLALVEAACRAQELEHRMGTPPLSTTASTKKGGGWFGT